MTEEAPFLSKTKHILYIYSNARYCCSNGDHKEFKRTIPLVNAYSSLSLDSPERYTYDYIVGMYPEFAEALKYFEGPIREEAQRITTSPERKSRFEGAAIFPDEILEEMAADTIKKFNLKETYDFSSPPNAVQTERINHRFLPKQKREMKKFLPQALAYAGLAFAEKCKNFRLVNKFMKSTSTVLFVARGDVDKEDLKDFMGKPGISLGCDLLQLREKGILDEDLNIKDQKAFMNSKVMTDFEIEGKKYNLNENLLSAQLNQYLMSSSLNK